MRLASLIVAVLLVTGITSAQEDVLRPHGRPGSASPSGSTSGKGIPFILGLEAGANFNFFSQAIDGTWEESPYNVYDQGLGVSPFFGLYADIGLSESFGIGVRILYDRKSFGNSQDEALLDCFVENQGYTVAPISVEYTESVSYVTINPVLRWQATPQFFVHLGPVIQFAVDSLSNTTTFTVDESEACRFYYGTPQESTTLTTEGSAAADPSTRFGIDVGLGYRIPLSSTIDLVPRLGYQLMFTPYSQDVEFLDDSRANTIDFSPATATSPTLNSLQLSLSLWFNL